MSDYQKELDAMIELDCSSFHTPGHKGIGALPLKYDITELKGFESLYENTGAINKLEAEYSLLYGCNTVISAGGSTLCIQAMLAMVAGLGKKVIASRVIHQSAVNAMALLDLEPVWIYPDVCEDRLLAKPTTPEQVKHAIEANPDAKVVYITSPDYYGQIAEIETIAKLCKANGVKLVVDCAHGAHLRFCPHSEYPIDLGADLCCASLHKTLPAMTGAAVLSMGAEYSPEFAKRKMSLFGSTSPSYAIIHSIARLLDVIGSDGSEMLESVVNRVDYTKSILKSRGISFLDAQTDASRLVFRFDNIGYNSEEMLNLMVEFKLMPEFIDESYCVLIPTINNSERDWERLHDFFSKISVGNKKIDRKFEYSVLERVLTLREAVMAVSERVNLEQAEGRVAVAVYTPCPPGIPLVVPGERLDKSSVELIKKFGINEVDVV